MRIINILIILILVSFLFGQSSISINPDVIRVRDLPAKQKNIIDMQSPPEKIKAQRITNQKGEIRKQNRAMGSAKTSGPAQILKNEGTKTTISNKELKQHLREPEVLEPIK